MNDLATPAIPIATYRLQFRNGMTFERAAGLIEHWKALGISHVYASPIFAAAAGSTHGYDVSDPNVIDPEIGGIEGFRAFSDALVAAGLGLILDIVPNHMAASLDNPYWRSVVKFGSRSPWASMFDNDWKQKLTLPVLTGPLREEIEAGHGRLVRDEQEKEVAFDYRGSLYPLDPETCGGASVPSDTEQVLQLLERQPWQMIRWQEAAKGLSYRRFFEVTGLVGVRVEDPEIFAETHRLILDLVSEGRVQGLRIDHIDGLADPAGYLERLRQAAGPDVYIVVEKILEGEEQLPASWPVQGTTGYEFIADLAGLFCAEDPALDEGWQEVAPDFGDPEEQLGQAKRLMAEVNFEGEVSGLCRQALAIAQEENRTGIAPEAVTGAVRGLVTGFHVYRTYGTPDGLEPEDESLLAKLFERLRRARPELDAAVGLVEDVVFGRVGEASRQPALAFRTRMQNLTGPILAKALEDTFFYRFNRLIALNEVGGDPIGRAGGIDHFHERMITRAARQPHGLTTTSTHDTKRGEDARARLYAISEAAQWWVERTRSWRQRMADHVGTAGGRKAPEPDVEWLLFQALAGMIPPNFDPGSEADRGEVRDRFLPYVEKFLREAKLRSNWTEIDEAYEGAVKDYAAAAIGSPEFMRDFWRDIRPIVRTGLVNSLSQTLVKLTAPGVPDIYQGTEGFDASLVDPDNRRMPDYDGMTVPEQEPPHEDFAAVKSWLIGRVVHLRRSWPELFARGDYLPLETSGQRSDNVLAFARRHNGRSVIVLVPRLVHDAVTAGTLQSRDCWGDTELRLPEGMRNVRDAFTDELLPSDVPMEVATLLQQRPFALLLAEG